jgi:hypothetical protein
MPVEPMPFEVGRAGKNLARISRLPGIDNSRARWRFIECRFHRDEMSLFKIFESIYKILRDFIRPKLAHLLDETLTLGLRQGFDFFDDLFRGHLIRIPTKLTIYLQKEQCPRLPCIISRL